MSMHVLEIVSGTTINGAVTHCLLVSRELARRGHRVTAVCRPEAWVAPQFAAAGIEVIASDLRRWPPGELRRIGRFARQNGVDVIHTHMSRAHLFGVLLRFRSGIACAASAQSRHFQLHWMFNDLVIAASEATRRYHMRWNLVPSGRIVTIANFVDTDLFAPPSDDSRRQSRAECGLEDDDLLLGVIGHLFPRKGQLYLVEALPEIVAAAPGARLILVGDVNIHYADQVKDAARRGGVADRIIWAGQHDNVRPLLEALDVCVLPSLEETLPLTVLEAMASGLPVVATAVGGTPECIVDSQTGVLIPPADPPALSRAIIPLLQDADRRRRMAAAARRYVEEHFSIASQLPRIEEALARAARSDCGRRGG